MLRSQPSHHGEAGGAGWPVLRAASRQHRFIAGMFSRERGGARLPSPHPSASPAGSLTELLLRGIKKKRKKEKRKPNPKDNLYITKQHPHIRSSEGTSVRAGGRLMAERHGTLAPGIYRTAGDRFRITGVDNLQSGPPGGPHPAQPQEVDRMVSEQRPVGSECGPLCPSPSASRPPRLVKERRLPGLPCPSTPSWATASQYHNSSTPPKSFWNASLGTPAPKGCRDVHTESRGWLHATVKGMLFCPGEASSPP